MNKKRMYNLFLVSLVVIVYLLVTLGLFIYQRSLLYHPVENNYYGDKLTVEVKKIQIPKKNSLLENSPVPFRNRY